MFTKSVICLPDHPAVHQSMIHQSVASRGSDLFYRKFVLTSVLEDGYGRVWLSWDAAFSWSITKQHSSAAEDGWTRGMKRTMSTMLSVVTQPWENDDNVVSSHGTLDYSSQFFLKRDDSMLKVLVTFYCSWVCTALSILLFKTCRFVSCIKTHLKLNF